MEKKEIIGDIREPSKEEVHTSGIAYAQDFIPAIRVPRSIKWKVIRYYVFTFLKWLQVFICLMTIIIGIIFELIFLIWGKKAWRWQKTAKKNTNPWDRCECELTIMSLKFWKDVIFWVFVEVSIPGLIGAAGEIIYLQLIYALAATPIYPYTIVPWVVAAGLWKGWTVRPDH